MGGSRRNSISHDHELVARAIAGVSGVVAAFAGNEPTGAAISDVVFVAVFAAFVTWSGASASWWALMGAAGLATSGAISGPVLILLPALLVLGASTLIGWKRVNQPVARAVIAAVVIQVVLRLEWNPFFLSSALLAAAAAGLIIVSGVLRRDRYVRRRLYWGAVAVVGFFVLAIAGMGVAALQASEVARDGYVAMLDGLESVQKGETPEASATLHAAAADLDSAGATLGGWLTQPARLVPGVAQNRNAAARVLASAGESAEAAATTLGLVDLQQLTIKNGVIDVAAFAALATPLDKLLATIEGLDETLRNADSPWLIPPFQSRLDSALERAHQVVPQARATAAAARIAPAMLGVDGERRYFLAFVNNAEARGHSGLMGNWSEVTISNGRLKVTANGRTARLQSPELFGLELDASDEYLARYGGYGAKVSLGGGVNPKFWSNVTFPPDMPSVGNAMAQMYERATGRTVDGVIVIDPTGIASLLDVTGPIELDDIDRRINGGNAERFLQLEQYEYAENEREDLLAAVTEQTVNNVLEGDLPPPQRMMPILADAALNGHISAWAVRSDEQELLELVGMDASLPVITEAGIDAFAVSNINGAGNKIDTFLERTIDYRAVVDEQSGDVSAKLRVEFTNTAPTTGYADYVIGNIVGDPINNPVGSSRMLIHVHTVLGVQAARLDGVEFEVRTLPELGYNVWTTVATVPAGETLVLELDMVGNIGPGVYRLVYRPQPLPNVDDLELEATTTDGRSIFDYEGQLERRTIISADIIEAWR
jgi:hypothetical protein